MSISFITGKPGGGKGLLAMQQVVDELRNSKRPIITNLAIRVQPWVNGAGQAQVGLKEYLKRKYGNDFDCEHRVWILQDEECSSFFLWRVVGVNGERHLEKAEAVTVPTKDGECKIVEFKTELGLKAGPVLYVIDEAWKFWRARNWQKTGEGLEFYNAQHRKFGDDVLICTQHTKQVDPAIHRVAQDFWVVKNHSKMSLGAFRQPDVFSVAIYDQAPTGAALEPMSRKLFRLDKKGLAQTYDTSAGVGLAGQGVADIGARKRGWPWWLLPALIVVLCIVAGQAHKMVGAGVAKMMFGGQKVQTPAKVNPVANAERSVASAVPLGGSSDERAELKPEVFLTAICRIGKETKIFLSNGEQLDMKNPRVWFVGFSEPRYVVIDGVTNRFKPHETVSDIQGSALPRRRVRGGESMVSPF